MTTPLTPELYWLTATVALTAVMWVPYVLQLIAQLGLVAAAHDPHHETPPGTRWAQRAKRAHANAVENLAILAPLAITVHVAGAGTSLTATACAVYFLARAGHYIVYVLAVPYLRTLLFAVGVACQAILAARLLGWIG